MSAPKLTRNPNRAKLHNAARMQNEQRIRWSDVTTRYMPGKTKAARIAGIQSYYARQLELREIGA